MLAKMRLFLTANAAAAILVAEDHPLAATLYAAIGDEIPQSAVERFGLVDGKLPEKKSSSSAATLLGSNVLPSMVEIGPDKKVQLGHVVARAHKASGLSVEDWNAQADADREALLAKAVSDWQAELATKPASTPRARKVAVSKSAPTPKNKEAPAPANKEKDADQDKSGGQSAP